MIEFTECSVSVAPQTRRQPAEIHVWAGPNRWSLRAAAVVLEEALIWFHDHEDLGREVEDAVLEAADDRFWKLLNALIYEDEYDEDLQ